MFSSVLTFYCLKKLIEINFVPGGLRSVRRELLHHVATQPPPVGLVHRVRSGQPDLAPDPHLLPVKPIRTEIVWSLENYLAVNLYVLIWHGLILKISLVFFVAI